jgi:uncharacterized membrane protein
MRTEDPNNASKEPERRPIFIPKGNGLGWTLNFDRPISYVILFGFLGATVFAILCIEGIIKL